jgi:hypothetical protein
MVEHRSIESAELDVAPPFELFNLFGNQQLNGFGQFFLEQAFIKTYLLKDRFDVFKHRKHTTRCV